jgi:hypothetical protein
MKAHLLICLLAIGLSLTAQAQITITPAENFKQALSIQEGDNVSFNFSTTAVAPEPGEPEIKSALKGTSSVWFKFKPSTSGYVRLDTVGSATDTIAAVYLGSSLTNLRMISRSDDPSGNTQARLGFEVHAGKTYFITVAGYSSSDAGGSVSVLLTRSFTFFKVTHVGSCFPTSHHRILALPQDNGMIVIDTSSTGNYTGRIYLGSKSYPFSGKWAFAADTRIHAQNIISRPDDEEIGLDFSGIAGVDKNNISVINVTITIYGPESRSFQTVLGYTYHYTIGNTNPYILHAVGSPGQGYNIFFVPKFFDIVTAVPVAGYTAAGTPYTFSARCAITSYTLNFYYHKAIPGGEFVSGRYLFPDPIAAVEHRWFKPRSLSAKRDFRNGREEHFQYTFSAYVPPVNSSQFDFILNYTTHLQFVRPVNTFDRIGSLFKIDQPVTATKITGVNFNIKNGTFSATWVDNSDASDKGTGSLRGLFNAATGVEEIRGISLHKYGVGSFRASP